MKFTYFDSSTINKIRKGYYSALYFNRTKHILLQALRYLGEPAKDQVGEAFIYPSGLREAQEEAQKINEFAREQNLLIATMESCTGLALANLFTDDPQNMLKLGLLTYHPVQKVFSGVSRQVIKDGVYNLQTARAMAEALRSKFSRDGIFISTTGKMDEWENSQDNHKTNQRELMKIETAEHILGEVSQRLQEVYDSSMLHL